MTEPSAEAREEACRLLGMSLEHLNEPPQLCGPWCRDEDRGGACRVKAVAHALAERDAALAEARRELAICRENLRGQLATENSAANLAVPLAEKISTLEADLTALRAWAREVRVEIERHAIANEAYTNGCASCESLLREYPG